MARTHTEPPNIHQTTTSSFLPSPPTFFEAIPEGSRSAHGACLLVKRHTGVSQTVVTARVDRGILIGQAVVAQTTKVNLS